VTYLDVPDGAIYSNALGVSEDGVVIVGQVNFSSGSEQWAEAVRWRDGVMERLGDVARGGSKGAAKDVTPDGSIIIGNGAGATRDQAFRWENGVMTLLGKLRGHSTAAMAVSADGSTIVGIAYNGGDRSRGHGIATIWDPAHGMRELKQVLEQDHGLDLSAFELNWANGISSDGRTIAGQGTVLDPGANREYAEREITWVVTFSKPSIWRCSTSAWSAAPR
jgi:probable HAF family extracellular repeat protein